jgi:putative heme-binding domain-containing protein
LERAGSIFKATRADEGVEFLASTDNWFRPVNFANTPSGTLLIVDMYRETIEHPHSIPEPIKRHLDLTSGRDRGRLWELVPEKFARRSRAALSTAPTARLVELLADPDAWWRETAQRLLIERHDAASVASIRRLAAAPTTTAVGRSHALWTLQDLGALRLDDLVPIAHDPEPGLREQIARLAGLLPERGACELLASLADDGDAMVRLQTAVALGDKTGPEALEPLARIAQRDGGDLWIRAALLSGLRHRAAAFLEILGSVPSYLSTPGGRTWLQELTTLVGVTGRRDEIERILDAFVKGGSDTMVATSAVLGLRRGIQRSATSPHPDLNRLAGAAIRSLQEKAEPILDENGEPARQIDAIRLFALGSTESALSQLVPLLDATRPNTIQLAALQTLGERDDPRIAAALIARWKALGPATRREAVEILLSRPSWVGALLDALQSKAIATSELDPARLGQLRNHADAAIRARAVAILGSTQRSDRAKVIASYRPALEREGDPIHGKQVFIKNCGTCHKAEGQGVDVGPDLATITGRTPEDLLMHILDPNREIAPTYINYTIATTEGRVVSGLIASEAAGSVTLKRAEGATEVVPRSQIEAMTSTGLSLMPENLESAIDPAAMADLIRYLRNLRAEPARPGNQ